MQKYTTADVKEFRALLTDYVEDIRSRSKQYKIRDFAVKRKFKEETLNNSGIFFIDKMAELVVPKYFDLLKNFGVISETNSKPIYNDRYVIPFYGMDKKVMGLVGYTWEAKERYVYATTQYFERNDAIYGLENIEQIIKDNYVIVVEGLTDRLRLIELGFKNVLCTAGAHKSLFMMQIFNMIDNVIFIPDRDTAGDGTIKYWKTNKYCRLLIPFCYKDLDEFATSSEENAGLLVQYINETIKYMFSIKTCVGEQIGIYG